MLKEALESIAAQAVKANTPKIIKPDAEPKHRYAIQNADGSLAWFDAAPATREHSALSLEPIVLFAHGREAKDPEIWYSRGGVTVFINGDERRNRATMKLLFSPQVSMLLAWDRQRTPMSQAQFVLTLRTTFARCLGRAGDLLTIIRRVKFTNNASGGSTIEHGKASIGKSIEQEVTGAAAIPEYVTLEVPIWDGSFRSIQPVDCALEIDTANATFSLIPLPQSIETAIADGESALGESIVSLVNANKDEAAVPVYYGSP